MFNLKNRRPAEINIIAAIYLLAPIANLAQARLGTGHPASLSWDEMTFTFGAFGSALILLSPVVSVGIYSGRLWGMAVFLLHSGVVLAANLALLLRLGHTSTVRLLVIDVLAFVAVFYMLRKDLRTPYLAREARGWRTSERVIRQLSVRLTCGDRKLAGSTVNISRHGVLLRSRDAQLAAGDLVHATFSTPTGDVAREAKVAWCDRDTFALAFNTPIGRAGDDEHTWQQLIHGQRPVSSTTEARA